MIRHQHVSKVVTLKLFYNICDSMKVNRNYLPHLRHVSTTHHKLPAGDAEATNPLEYEIPSVGNHQLPPKSLNKITHRFFGHHGPSANQRHRLYFFLGLLCLFLCFLQYLLYFSIALVRSWSMPFSQSPTGWQNRNPRIPGSQEKTG